MYGHTQVAIYASRADAERARDRLLEAGIPATDIRLSADRAVEPAPEGERRGGFWDWLFGDNIPEYDRRWYDENLREGRTALSVLVRNEAERDRIADILEEFNPIDFEHAPATPMPASPAGAAVPPAGRTELRGEQEQVIPVVKEELNVGKRASERRYRIRTYVVETPVERAVNLRDERIVVEHRPATGERVVGEADLPREREYEVIERHEEPVVTKEARKVEDVVVRKEAGEHTETVRDTVRETKVDLDKEAVERAGTTPNRRP